MTIQRHKGAKGATEKMSTSFCIGGTKGHKNEHKQAKMFIVMMVIQKVTSIMILSWYGVTDNQCETSVCKGAERLSGDEAGGHEFGTNEQHFSSGSLNLNFYARPY